ncbi:MAG TPA: ABC transporter permease [Vicinamibacterales bacterium]
MSAWKGLAARARSILRPGAAEARLEEEFQFHLETETKRLIGEGVPPADARRRALLAFGAIEGHREAMRDERGARWFDDLRADVRSAVQGMRRNPGFILAVTLTLGLGIGVNGIVFGYVNSMLFRPVPAHVPEELAALFTRDAKTGNTGGFGYDDFIDFRDRSGAFAGAAAMTGAPVNLVVPLVAGTAAGDMVWAEIVTEDFFSVLGVRPAIGRFFTADDAPQGGNPFAVLSYDAWQRRFQGDPNIAGRAIRINGSEFVVTGVAPRGFRGMRLLAFWPELWVPIGMQPVVQPSTPRLLHGRGGGPLLVFGRLKPGFDLERAQAVAAEFAKQLEAAYPASNTDVGVSLLPATVGFENPAIVKPRVLMLASALGVVGSLIVLLIICANLAVLQLARTASRAREIAIRLSLGCSRSRLTRQLLVESLLVAAPGVALGVAAMRLASPLEPYLSPKFPFQVGLAPTADIRVMFFTSAIAVAAIVLFGMIPAVRAGRSRLVPSSISGLGLRQSGAERPSRTRSVLVVSQLALSVILLIAASLFVRSLTMADAVNLGFEPRNRLVISMNVGLQGYDQARGLQFYDEVLRRTRLLPGVLAASFAYPSPFDTHDRGVRFYVDGLANTRDGTVFAQATFVADEFIPALGVRLQSGRDFTTHDGGEAPLVMIVSDSLANRLWPGKSAVGQRARYGSASGPDVTVVGVVADAKFAAVGEVTTRRAYLPLKQRYRDWETLVVHTRDTPGRMLARLREVIGGIDPSLPSFGAMTMEQAVANGFGASRSGVAVASFFGLLALLISSIGLYALVARSVADRTREIGVRVALGLTPRGVLAHLMRDGARLGLIGLVMGLAGGMALARAMAGLLLGLSPADPITFTLVPLALTIVIVVATFVPARRAARLDASAALRSE